MDGATVTLASGENFPDALAGSVLAAKLNAPIILVSNSNNEQEKFIESGQYTNEIVFGGNSSVSEYTQESLAK
jgi:putative cell wall-binding protein